MNSISQLTEAPILVLEDEPINQALIGNILSRMGLEYVTAENGREALKELENRVFSIYIVDLLMPVMNGEEFIRELRNRDENAVVLVQTTIQVPETIVEVMKLRVFDYLFKPFDPERFQKSVRAALDYHKYKMGEKEHSSRVSLKLRAQLEWLNYKEQRRATESTAHEKNLIYNLKTSMSQGAGIGAMVSMLELLEGNIVRGNGKCEVSCEILELIFKNLEISKRMIDGITSISDILESKITLVSGHSTDLFEIIQRKAGELSEIFSKKGIRFSISELPRDAVIAINKEGLENIIEEMLVNAVKYSPHGGEIGCLFHYAEGYLVVSLKNDIDFKAGGKGVPPEFEKLVTEPFIRFSTPDESVIHKEKFSIGLGLSVVDHIARLHRGHFFIRNIVDHLRQTPTTCVLSELLLPVVQ